MQSLVTKKDPCMLGGVVSVDYCTTLREFRTPLQKSNSTKEYRNFLTQRQHIKKLASDPWMWPIRQTARS